jgi:hypothetical protein
MLSTSNHTCIDFQRPRPTWVFRETPPCTLHQILDTEESKDAGLAQQNGFGPE